MTKQKRARSRVKIQTLASMMKRNRMIVAEAMIPWIREKKEDASKVQETSRRKEARLRMQI